MTVDHANRVRVPASVPNLKWQRRRNVWRLFDGEQKVGAVTCVAHHRDDGSMFYAFVKGKVIRPGKGDGRYNFKMGACLCQDETTWVSYDAGEGAWSSLYRAKQVVEMEYRDLLRS